MNVFALQTAFDRVHAQGPLVHCITNYVTVNDCANALLAIGASPIMSDEPADVFDITSICNALVLNIGTLNQHTIEGMQTAAKRAAQLEHPIVLDPVGAGASALRTQVASALLDSAAMAVVRANMSEVKALAGASAATRGVDVNPHDVVTDQNMAASAAFVRDFARQTGVIAAVSGAIDIISDGKRTFAIRNGHPRMGGITGAGCMLSCVVAAYAAANQDAQLESVVAAVAHMGLAGQLAAARMTPQDGTGSYRMFLLDALNTITADQLEQGAMIEELA